MGWRTSKISLKRAQNVLSNQGKKIGSAFFRLTTLPSDPAIILAPEFLGAGGKLS